MSGRTSIIKVQEELHTAAPAAADTSSGEEVEVHIGRAVQNPGAAGGQSGPQ